MNNPAKYVIGVCIQYMFLMNVMIICKCLGIFGLGTCSMLFPLTKDMKYNLKTINDNAKRRKIRPKIVKQFSQFVQFHCELIQLSFFIQKYFRSLMIKHNAISNVRCFLPFLFQFQVDSWLFGLIEDDFHNYFYIWNCCHLWDDAIVKHENGWVFRIVCLRVECDSKMFLIRVAGNIGGVITFY